MRQSDINAIMKACHQATDSLSCEEALTLGHYSGKTKGTGSSLFFECPNGCDKNKKLDKCAINVSKNFAHCFCCGEGWNATKLLAALWEVPYNQAALMYGKHVGAITDEQYTSIADDNGNLAKALKGTVKVKKAEQEAIEESEFKRPANHLDLVYRHLIQLDEFRLTDAHRDYLKNERKLSDEVINEIGFFSYAKPFSMAELTLRIQRENPRFNPKEHYWGVPGFYFRFKDESKTEGRWEFHKPYVDCIGIPIRDASGHIVALQMRALYKNAKVKYFFVTSKCYKPEDNIGYGSTPSTPCSVVYPKEIMSPFVYIGEGMFKMLEVARAESSICFSVQGVNNTKDVPQTIEDVMLSDYAKSRAPQINGKHLRMNIVIVYDADIYKNYGVIEASKTLLKGLKKKFPKVSVYFLLWDLHLGKGIDDLMHYAAENGIDYHSLCQVIPSDKFVALADHCVNVACDGKKSKKTFVTQEFSDRLYNEMWTKNLAHYF